MNACHWLSGEAPQLASKEHRSGDLELNRRYQLDSFESDHGPIASMHALTEQCSAAVEAREQVASPTAGRTAERHREPLACRPPCLADRHRRQCEFLGTAMEAALRELHPACTKPQAAVVSPTPPALGAHSSCKCRI